MRRSAAACACVLLLGAASTCTQFEPRTIDTALVDLSLGEVGPRDVLPGTRLIVTGDSFVDDPWGTSGLRLVGEVTTLVGTVRDVDLLLPAKFVDFDRLEVGLSADTIADLGGEGASFSGTATVEVRSAVDGTLYRSSSVDTTLDVHESLAPTLASVPPDGIIFPNEPIAVVGSGLLLAGEGETVAEAAPRALRPTASSPSATAIPSPGSRTSRSTPRSRSRSPTRPTPKTRSRSAPSGSTSARARSTGATRRSARWG